MKIRFSVVLFIILGDLTWKMRAAIVRDSCDSIRERWSIAVSRLVLLGCKSFPFPYKLVTQRETRMTIFITSGLYPISGQSLLFRTRSVTIKNIIKIIFTTLPCHLAYMWANSTKEIVTREIVSKFCIIDISNSPFHRILDQKWCFSKDCCV